MLNGGTLALPGLPVQDKSGKREVMSWLGETSCIMMPRDATSTNVSTSISGTVNVLRRSKVTRGSARIMPRLSGAASQAVGPLQRVSMANVRNTSHGQSVRMRDAIKR